MFFRSCTCSLSLVVCERRPAPSALAWCTTAEWTGSQLVLCKRKEEGNCVKYNYFTESFSLLVSGLHRLATFSGAPLMKTSKFGAPFLFPTTVILCTAESNG